MVIRKDESLFTAYILLLAMSVHSFFEGIAMGVEDEDEVLKIFLAIISHKWSESLTIGISFVNADIKLNRGI